MSETCLRTVVPDFESVEAMIGGLNAKANFEHVDLYPRDGSRLLGEIEAHLAHLAGVEESQALAYNSGMSAVTDAIDVALHYADTTTPTLACAAETYSQTKRFIENFLRGKRARVIYFDSGDENEVARIIDERQPDVVVAETVSNYINVPVLDTDFLLGYARGRDKRPVLVLDNTLPLSTAQPLGEKLNADDEVIVVESGTKSYTFNTELLGLSYTSNVKLIDYLRRYRRTRGSLPSLQALDFIGGVLPKSREVFDVRNRKLFKNTGDIALRLAADLGAITDFTISHPGLASHANNQLYTELYPEQAAPVFYIQSLRHNQYEVARRLWESADVRAQAKLGQSFGFDHVRIVADENVGAVRIAGGADTDGSTFGAACALALR